MNIKYFSVPFFVLSLSVALADEPNSNSTRPYALDPSTAKPMKATELKNSTVGASLVVYSGSKVPTTAGAMATVGTGLSDTDPTQHLVVSFGGSGRKESSILPIGDADLRINPVPIPAGSVGFSLGANLQADPNYLKFGVDLGAMFRNSDGKRSIYVGYSLPMGMFCERDKDAFCAFKHGVKVLAEQQILDLIKIKIGIEAGHLFAGSDPKRNLQSAAAGYFDASLESLAKLNSNASFGVRATAEGQDSKVIEHVAGRSNGSMIEQVRAKSSVGGMLGVTLLGAF